MYELHFTPAARMEMLDAMNWYEDELPGLGARFLGSIEEIVERIQVNPMQFPVVRRGIRRAMFRTFPYSLLFVVATSETVSVLACFHASRDPRRWHTRA